MISQIANLDSDLCYPRSSAANLIRLDRYHGRPGSDPVPKILQQRRLICVNLCPSVAEKSLLSRYRPGKFGLDRYRSRSMFM